MGAVVFIFEHVIKPVAILIGAIAGASALAALCVYVFGKVVGAF